MNSITNAVKVTYGLNDVPEPLFQCPVIFDPKILQVFKGSGTAISTVVSAAAHAVELVSRFERSSRYVDFSPTPALASGELSMTLRVQLVQVHSCKVARIDFCDTDCQPRR